ncbi:AAA family ATPase [Nocardioides ungokensis]
MSFTEIKLENFRGVRQATTIVMTRPGDGAICSLLLYGENGSGKSSICDAFEFATRGVVSRRLRDGTKIRREIRNMSAGKKSFPCVEVQLSSGEKFRRGNRVPSWSKGESNPPPTYLDRARVMSAYEYAPIVIRRSAVEVFWQIPPVQRQEFFWDYLKAPAEGVRTAADEQSIEEHARANVRLMEADVAVRKLIPVGFRFARATTDYSLPTHAAGMKSLRNAASIVLHGAPGRALDPATSALLDRYEQALRQVLDLTPLANAARRRSPRDFSALQEILEDVGARVSEDYRSITQQPWVAEVQFVLEETGALEIRLIRDTGKELLPEEVLSEAHLDLLALLILLEVHVACAERGQSKFIVLDDVFQSIDAPLRSRALQHLANRLVGWQMVMTVHDRLWMEIAQRCLNETGKPTQALEIRSSGFGSTPTVIGVNPGHLRDLHQVVQSAASAVVVAGTAGRTFEALCHHLSIWCKVSVRRKAEDKYTIGDLWPGVQAALRACTDSEVASLAEELGHSQFLRNIAGAHFTAWADGLSDAEALDSAHRVELLHNKFWCETCGRPAKRTDSGNRTWSISKTCGHV